MTGNVMIGSTWGGLKIQSFTSGLQDQTRATSSANGGYPMKPEIEAQISNPDCHPGVIALREAGLNAEEQ